MKLSKRNSLLGAVVVVVALLSWFAWDAWQSASTSGAANPYSAAKMQEIKEKAKKVEEAKASGDARAIEKAEQSLIETIGGRAGKMLSMARSRNLPMEMYGKVIDQHGQPVDNAEVYMMVAGGGTYAPGSGPVRVRTNEEGVFHLKALGQDVSVDAVKHPDLAKAQYCTEGGNVRAGAGLLLATDGNGEEYNWRNHTTPATPFIIHVWRVEKFEDVKSGSGGFLPIPNDKDDTQAGIVASCKREPKEANTHWRHQKGSWSITFRPIDGGIQETDDIYLNEAPESGYQKELTVSMQRGDPDYKVNIQPARRYYYTAHNGEWYGAFSATFEPYMLDDKCLVKMSFKYNPHSSRNLAVVPNR